MEDFQIYEGLKGKHKKHLVFNKVTARVDIVKAAKRFFKCSEAHLVIVNGFIYDGLLYLENPHKKGVRGVWVALYA